MSDDGAFSSFSTTARRRLPALFADYLGGLKAHIVLSDRLTWDTSAYGHGETTQSTWTTPYYPSPNVSPLSELRKAPGIRRFGVLSQVHYDIAHNQLGAGVWYENNSYQSPEYDFQMPNIVNGKLTEPLPNPLNYWTNPFAKIYNQDYSTNCSSIFRRMFTPMPSAGTNFVPLHLP
ncbi:hypothetical protein [Gluconobacter wancherniae]|uniref:TonB-dependent receptor-like beta-barrel domain-containing protein n=1 Tax=Gluconobacter wancherniae NBRC 103581 TaxID=656744 RepID=A0A511AYK9_9PROT|nr:hypothetical protein [Gluconobacter wancherniae]GBD55801.1 TonB-dependent receptor [Gluconobacter wancherniae NBRC 103581]GBR66115.1 hypothetical protein AA103581_2180 [Gluconobacter wancherniae NBRC 103581]GEK93294.1 hypothetical protein GWA01_10640 [Gluconobacter wancherniae NBRC 103581]